MKKRKITKECKITNLELNYKLEVDGCVYYFLGSEIVLLFKEIYTKLGYTVTIV